MRRNFLKIRKNIVSIPKLKKDIFKIDKNIRFITIIDFKGKLIESQHKTGIKSILNKKESKHSIKQITRFWKENKDLFKKFGYPKYAIIEYDKIKRIIISLNKKELLYMTAEPDSNHKKILSKIFALYHPQKKKL
jgi:hypothetical protein